jgi:Zn-dependent M28 family amino/carboxypeptidase
VIQKITLILFLYIQLDVTSQSNNQVEYFISVLAHDSLEGRGINTKGIKKAKQFIIETLKKNDLKSSKLFNYNNRFRIDSFGINGYNVLAKIDNKKDSSILLMAHYDHLDTCSGLSKELFERRKCLIHNGADDNASGVALLLSLAIDLKSAQAEFQKYNYIVAFTSAHEIGLLGASALVESRMFRREKIKLVLNFDMVGRLNESSKKIFVSKSTLKAFPNITVDTCAQLVNDELNINNTDASIFAKKGYSCFSFTTGKHEDYHCATDDSTRINIQGIYLLKNITWKFLQSL